jgi:hypothetical protein
MARTNECFNIARKLQELAVNVQMYHWGTASYSRHIASDKLYSGIIQNTDKFVEVYIGKYGRPQFQKSEIRLRYISDKDFPAFLNEFADLLVSLTEHVSVKDSDLLTIRDDLLSLVNQTKYLCTLK